MWPGFDSQIQRHMWVEFLLVLILALRIYLPVLQFTVKKKKQYFQFLFSIELMASQTSSDHVKRNKSNGMQGAVNHMIIREVKHAVFFRERQKLNFCRVPLGVCTRTEVSRFVFVVNV